MLTLKDSKTHDNVKHAFARRVSGQPALPLLRAPRRYRGIPEIGDLLRDTTPRLSLANRFCFGSAPSCGYMTKIERPELVPTEDCKFVAAP